MNRMLPALAGVAAVALVALVAVGLYFNQPRGMGGVPPTPTQAPSPSAAPSPTAEPSPTSAAAPSPANGGLAEGTFVLSDGEFDDGLRNVPITVTIPAPGWYGEPGNGILEKSGEQNFGPEHAGLIGPFSGDIYVPADPCQWSTTMPDNPATTVDEVVVALQGQASRNASDAMDITVDGHAGKSITLHVPDDAGFHQCNQGEFCTLSIDDPAVCDRYHQFPGQIDELWIVDVNGDVVVIDAMWSDATPAEDVAELRAILDSMQFETR